MRQAIENDDTADAVTYPAALIDDLARLADALALGMGRSSPDHVGDLIGGLANAYRAEKLTAHEGRARLATYTRLLADIPPDILAAAVDQAACECKFFPAIAEIRERAQHRVNMRRFYAAKAKAMVAAWQRDQATPKLAPPPDDGAPIDVTALVGSPMGRATLRLGVSLGFVENMPDLAEHEGRPPVDNSEDEK